MHALRRPSRPRAAALAAGLLLAGSAVSTGCSPGSGGEDRGAALRVTTTTGIIADFVRHVGGERVDVSSIVPGSGDPHSYEPSPGDVKKVARADVLFSNGLVLEEPSITKLVDANAPGGAPAVALGEELRGHGGTAIPLEEDLGLDVLWLGLAVHGGLPDGVGQVRLTATEVEGPGEVSVYLEDTLARPVRYIDSGDGLGGRDSVTLPPDAHTHVNWAFSEPGTYRLTLAARAEGAGGEPLGALGEGTFTFAVESGSGNSGPGRGGKRLLDGGHADVAVDTAGRRLVVRTEEDGEKRLTPAGDVVFDVPRATRETVPDDAGHAFLGAPGERVWVLPQAVLGKHVHGDTDPHTWQDVGNAKAYVRAIEETLTRADPAGRGTYRHGADRYLAELDRLDAYVDDTLASVPPDRRRLITTHDGFGYLAKAYGLEVAGFVVPNPGKEPSASGIADLGRTIDDLDVPAVFVEPNLAARGDVLRRVARDEGVDVCVLYGDAYDDEVRDYRALMRHNAEEIARCLGGG